MRASRSFSDSPDFTVHGFGRGMLFIFRVRSLATLGPHWRRDGRPFLELMPLSRCISSAPTWRGVLYLTFTGPRALDLPSHGFRLLVRGLGLLATFCDLEQAPPFRATPSQEEVVQA